MAGWGSGPLASPARAEPSQDWWQHLMSLEFQNSLGKMSKRDHVCPLQGVDHKWPRPWSAGPTLKVNTPACPATQEGLQALSGVLPCTIQPATSPLGETKPRWPPHKKYVYSHGTPGLRDDGPPLSILAPKPAGPFRSTRDLNWSQGKALSVSGIPRVQKNKAGPDGTKCINWLWRRWRRRV